MDKLNKNLQSLRAIKLDSQAKARGRVVLLSNLASDQTEKFSLLKYLISHPLVLKPLTYVAAVVLLFLFGSSYTFSAATNALPGNTLYPVKLQLEKLQVTMTSDQMLRAKKQIEFTDRRWQEFQNISESDVLSLEKQEQVARAARYFNDSLQEMKNSLNEVSQVEKNTTSNGAVDIAQLVNTKTKQYEEKLAGEYVDLPISVKLVIAKEVEEIKFQSLELLVTKYEQGSSSVSQSEVEVQLQSKLISLVEKASTMTGDRQTTALEKLQSVQTALSDKKYSLVVSSIRTYEQWLVEEKAKAEATTEEATTTEGEVLGEEEVVDETVNTVSDVSANTSTEKVIE